MHIYYVQAFPLVSKTFCHSSPRRFFNFLLNGRWIACSPTSDEQQRPRQRWEDTRDGHPCPSFGLLRPFLHPRRNRPLHCWGLQHCRAGNNLGHHLQMLRRSRFRAQAKGAAVHQSAALLSLSLMCVLDIIGTYMLVSNEWVVTSGVMALSVITLVLDVVAMIFVALFVWGLDCGGDANRGERPSSGPVRSAVFEGSRRTAIVGARARSRDADEGAVGQKASDAVRGSFPSCPKLQSHISHEQQIFPTGGGSRSRGNCRTKDCLVAKQEIPPPYPHCPTCYWCLRGHSPGCG